MTSLGRFVPSVEERPSAHLARSSKTLDSVDSTVAGPRA